LQGKNGGYLAFFNDNNNIDKKLAFFAPRWIIFLHLLMFPVLPRGSSARPSRLRAPTPFEKGRAVASLICRPLVSRQDSQFPAITGLPPFHLAIGLLFSYRKLHGLPNLQGHPVRDERCLKE